MSLTPQQYWRSSQEWRKWIGRTGTVVASTVIRSAGFPFEQITPYPLLLVEFGKQRKLFLGIEDQHFQIGDVVEVCLRRFPTPTSADILQYGLKVKAANLA